MSALDCRYYIKVKQYGDLLKWCHLLDDFVATKAGDKLRRGSYGEVPLQIDATAIPALLHQVQPGHARPVLRNTKKAHIGPM